MKKIISFILAAIMMLSCSAMAYAQETDISPLYDRNEVTNHPAFPLVVMHPTKGTVIGYLYGAPSVEYNGTNYSKILSIDFEVERHDGDYRMSFTQTRKSDNKIDVTITCVSLSGGNTVTCKYRFESNEDGQCWVTPC